LSKADFIEKFGDGKEVELNKVQHADDKVEEPELNGKTEDV